jgi:hypothetical protein
MNLFPDISFALWSAPLFCGAWRTLRCRLSGLQAGVVAREVPLCQSFHLEMQVQGLLNSNAALLPRQEGVTPHPSAPSPAHWRLLASTAHRAEQPGSATSSPSKAVSARTDLHEAEHIMAEVNSIRAEHADKLHEAELRGDHRTSRVEEGQLPLPPKVPRPIRVTRDISLSPTRVPTRRMEPASRTLSRSPRRYQACPSGLRRSNPVFCDLNGQVMLDTMTLYNYDANLLFSM